MRSVTCSIRLTVSNYAHLNIVAQLVEFPSGYYKKGPFQP